MEQVTFIFSNPHYEHFADVLEYSYNWIVGYYARIDCQNQYHPLYCRLFLNESDYLRNRILNPYVGNDLKMMYQSWVEDGVCYGKTRDIEFDRFLVKFDYLKEFAPNGHRYIYTLWANESEYNSNRVVSLKVFKKYGVLCIKQINTNYKSPAVYFNEYQWGPYYYLISYPRLSGYYANFRRSALPANDPIFDIDFSCPNSNCFGSPLYIQYMGVLIAEKLKHFKYIKRNL